jgi:hypothetical protein
MLLPGIRGEFMMEGYPVDGWPRLSGTLLYGPPHSWRIVDRKESLEIVPAAFAGRMFLYLAIIGFGLIVAAQLLLKNVLGLPIWWSALAASAMASSMIIAYLLMRALFARQHHLGPFLVISFTDRTVYLPRHGRSWPFDKIVGWEIVRGAWVRESDGQAYLFPDVISEMQVVVQNGSDERSAWPVIGALGHLDHKLISAADTIARRMALPLFALTDQATGFGSVAIGSRKYERDAMTVYGD